MGTSLPTNNVNDTGKYSQFCSFRIADQLYGINICDVKEITTEVPLTPVFHAPRHVKGYVNIRGQIHMVLDLKYLLGQGSLEYNESCKVILFKQTVGESFGVLVERIQDVVEVDNSKIESRRKEKEQNSDDEDGTSLAMSHIVRGVYKLPENLMVIIRAENLLKT